MSSLIVMLVVTTMELMMMAKVVIMMEVKGGGRVGLPASTEQVAAKLDPVPSKILHHHDYHDQSSQFNPYQYYYKLNNMSTSSTCHDEIVMVQHLPHHRNKYHYHRT